MAKALIEGPAAGPQPVDLKLRKLIVNLGNEYVRLSARDRRKVNLQHALVWLFWLGNLSQER